MDLLKRLASLIVPEGLVLLAAVVVLQLDALREPLETVARFYPRSACTATPFTGPPLSSFLSISRRSHCSRSAACSP